VVNEPGENIEMFCLCCDRNQHSTSLTKSLAVYISACGSSIWCSIDVLNQEFLGEYCQNGKVQVAG
jgi:hypothetical protein